MFLSAFGQTDKKNTDGSQKGYFFSDGRVCFCKKSSNFENVGNIKMSVPQKIYP